MDRKTVEKIKKDLKFIERIQEIHSVLLFGSYIKGDENERSDIDICLVIPHVKEKEINMILGLVFSKLSKKEDYDISIFETLPLFMKAEVIENHVVLFSRDVLELYEYFYFYRKIWNDQKHRQKLSREEMIKLFKK
ncbi:MAG: nucleotidyltransferase domain-containing protein [Candidatus Asgardarchaeia archaeon]